jgi:pre-mRNA-splicing factor SYF1
MYADIEESLGTVDTTKTVYNRMLELRVATPQVGLLKQGGTC